jgi:hypothetical protein
LAHVKGQKVEEQGSIPVSLQADHFRLDLFGELSVDIFKVSGFAATAWAVIDNFHLNDFFPEVDEAHNTLLRPLADRQ